MQPRPGTPIAPDRLERAKIAYSVRRVDLDRSLQLVPGPDERPRHGDLVLAEVVQIGQHSRLELTTSRRATLFVGDEVVVAYGARYAPDQFEAELPGDLGECELVAAGGCAASVRSRHSAVRDATRLRPAGLLRTPGGNVLNVADGALPAPPRRPSIPERPHVPTVLVAGTSMNAGKTTTVTPSSAASPAPACASALESSPVRAQVATATATTTPALPRSWTSPTSASSPPTGCR